jgi:TusA-related sulfurtransferase
MQEIIPDEFLDLIGVPCPRNSGLAIVKLETMFSGEYLEVVVDDGEPIENVPPSIEEDGEFKIVEKEMTDDKHWRLLVKVL